MHTLLTLQTQMNEEFSKAASFFGEDPAKTRSDEFFETFTVFLTDFEVRESFINKPLAIPLFVEYTRRNDS